MPIRPEQFVILKRHLEQVYVPHLPKLLQPRSPGEDLAKNVDRSFAAFAVDHLCGLDPKKACKTVVDDFDDYGIDAIHYHHRTKTLFVVQAKLKERAAFIQAEALAFAQGIRKLINGDYSGFNANVLARESTIRYAMDNCDKIEIVIAHIGEGITANAAQAIDELLADKAGGDKRLGSEILDFDAARTVSCLQSVNAVPPVNCRITLYNHGAAIEPKIAYYGTVALSALSDLHKAHGKGLYQKNIRTWLGQKTPVNEGIRRTLAENPSRFQYLNNGVTALCENISPRAGKGTEYRDFELVGFSIINGAQTVASTASFVEENPNFDISEARVMLTLIQADAEGDFGKEVTRARNTQNDVKEIAFAALDDEQERVRRELHHLDIEYIYRVGEVSTGSHANRIYVAEAIQALSLLEIDPRFPVWMKRSLTEFQKTDGEAYKQVFSQSLNSIALANAVTVYRYIKSQVAMSVKASMYDERKTYKHLEYVLAYVFAKQFRNAILGNQLISWSKLPAQAGQAYDELRQKMWDLIGPNCWPGPLARSKNQDQALDLLRQLMVGHYALENDNTIEHLRNKYQFGQPYPIDLFKYLASKAPQIGDLT